MTFYVSEQESFGYPTSVGLSLAEEVCVKKLGDQSLAGVALRGNCKKPVICRSQSREERGSILVLQPRASVTKNGLISI